MFALLASLAGNLDPAAAEEAARIAGRIPASTERGGETSSGPDVEVKDEGQPEAQENDEAEVFSEEGSTEQSEILIGDEAIKALNPAVSGPAIQVLPLAICT
jgi:hypothetical protein